MKKAIRYGFLIAFIMFTSVLGLKAQPHPGVQDGGGANTGGPIGAGAPIGSGTLLLIALAVAYGGRKMYTINNNNPEA